MVPVAGSAYTYAYATLGSCSPGSSAGTSCVEESRSESGDGRQPAGILERSQGPSR